MAAKKTSKTGSKSGGKKSSTGKTTKKTTVIKDLDLDDLKGGKIAGCGSQEGAYC